DTSNSAGPIKMMSQGPIEPIVLNNDNQGDEDANADGRTDALASIRERFEHNKRLADLIFSAQEDDSNDCRLDRGSGSEDSDFDKEKEKFVTTDAPKTEDVTLPGWGAWSGPGLPTITVPKIQVLKHTAGVDPKKRKDSQLR